MRCSHKTKNKRLCGAVAYYHLYPVRYAQGTGTARRILRFAQNDRKAAFREHGSSHIIFSMSLPCNSSYRGFIGGAKAAVTHSGTVCTLELPLCRFKGVRGVKGGLRGELEIPPWPPFVKLSSYKPLLIPYEMFAQNKPTQTILRGG